MKVKYEMCDGFNVLNAVAMNKANPDTFDVPSWSELSRLKPGDFVKILIGYERFWLRIKDRSPDKFTGIVDNHINIDGLKYGDELSVPFICAMDYRHKGG